MKRTCVGLAVMVLIVAGVVAGQTRLERKHVTLNRSEDMSALPFSEGVLAGNTLYVAGTIGLDATGKPPASAEEEARLAMEGVKKVVESQGMTMDDIVSVQVFCTDLSLYDTFNKVYRTYFHAPFPARAFVGVASLLRGGHFEVMATAVRQGGLRNVRAK
ncbi:MAG TPA: Rid family hydrolase [Candidatus Limnocylindrales bacterium]|nr:Rid family hydrolase [Candidatus Limnocylindrales bacterium]